MDLRKHLRKTHYSADTFIRDELAPKLLGPSERLLFTLERFTEMPFYQDEKKAEVHEPVVFFKETGRCVILTDRLIGELYDCVGSNGSMDTREWVGKQVCLGVRKNPRNKNQWWLTFTPASQATRPPQQAPVSTIGESTADKLMARLRELGSNSDEFLAWLRKADQASFETLRGKHPADWPTWSVKAMTDFVAAAQLTGPGGKPGGKPSPAGGGGQQRTKPSG